ncbi:serine/threonine-protein kinase [Streptomyces sp. WMMC897]|uniref:serine/threonine-protein kinase n=1 Tax=Streptomyces sp. WMMC897 TaxID=3014782 RepID=UPI0022B6F5D6|nr:serine/threonine-protein kinase [Streptomyces sp. WMMC897]MCZ7414561.1 serine/threonine-protein kinase [Streptomyces sp. WMMC897]
MRPVGSKYLLEEALGRGATGTVWRGRQRETAGEEAAVAGSPGELVAIKVLKEELAGDPDVVMRFLRERSVLLRLTHENIVRTRDLVVEGDLLALVMDLVDGPDLHRHLRENGPLTPVAAALITAQIADALAASHDDGVVHRDLKPANVLLAEDGDGMRPMLTDFGIARLADSPGLTRTHEFVGTPAYVAPESAEGRPQTSAVDVYGAGILLYELLTGRPPFGGGTALEVLHRHLNEDPRRPEGLPEPLWTVVERCLRKRPQERPSAAALARALRTVAAGIAPDAAPEERSAALGVAALLAPDPSPAPVPGTGGAPGTADADPTQVLPAGSGAPAFDPNAATRIMPHGGPGEGAGRGASAAPGGLDGTAVMPQHPPAEPSPAAAEGGGAHPWESQLRAARDRNAQTQYQPLDPGQDPLRRRPPRRPAPQQPDGGQQPGPAQRSARVQPAAPAPDRQDYASRAPQQPQQYQQRSAPQQYQQAPQQYQQAPQPYQQQPRHYEPQPQRYEERRPARAPREPGPARRRGANPMRIPGLGCLKGCLFMILILAAIVALVWNFTPVPEWVAEGRSFWETMVDWFGEIREAVGARVDGSGGPGAG